MPLSLSAWEHSMVLLNPSLWCQCCIPSQIETKGVGIWAQVGIIAFPAWFCFFQIHRGRLLGLLENNRKLNVTNFEGRIFLKFVCQETYIHSLIKNNNKNKSLVFRSLQWAERCSGALGGVFWLCTAELDFVSLWHRVSLYQSSAWSVVHGDLCWYCALHTSHVVWGDL